METTLRTATLAGFCLTALLAACQESGTGPEALSEQALLMLADQAMSDADADMDHVRAPGIPGLAFPGRVPGFGIGDTPDCPQENGTFICTRDSLGGIVSVTAITLRDGLGNAQNAYDEETTASVELSSTMEGTIQHERFAASVDRSRDMTVTGLLGAETTRVWNGSSAGQSTRTHFGGPFAGEEVTTTSESVVDALTLPLPGDDERGWPLSGTITTDMSSDGGPRAGDHRVVITFDGTQFATVNIDGEIMTVDLAERARGRHHGMMNGGPGGG